MKDKWKNLSIALLISFVLIVPQAVYLYNVKKMTDPASGPYVAPPDKRGEGLIPWPLFFVLIIGQFSIYVIIFCFVVGFLRNWKKKKK